VWRLQDEDGDATNFAVVEDDPMLISNLSVWTSPEAMAKFAWKTVHKRFYQKRHEWFEPLGSRSFVMWWVPEGEVPTLAESYERLRHLNDNGPSEKAFSWEAFPGVAAEMGLSLDVKPAS